MKSLWTIFKLALVLGNGYASSLDALCDLKSDPQDLNNLIGRN